MPYDRGNAVTYAHKWAFGRNPDFYNFDEIGGDCTNFISQCIYAGSGIMNFTPHVGWYFNSPGDRAAAWTGVEYLHRFLTTNKGLGPYATEAPLSYTLPGDVIQLSFDGNTFSHSLIVVNTRPSILVATHTMDSDNRPLRSYIYERSRLLHIEGVRT